MLALLFAPGISHSATLYLHGETHQTDRCVRQRENLAETAASGASWFFTENAFTQEWVDPWSAQRLQSMVRDQRFTPRVQGLESPYSWTIGIFFMQKEDFIRHRGLARNYGRSPRRNRKIMKRAVELVGARGALSTLLSDNGICENEPVSSAFCQGIEYDPGSAYSLSSLNEELYDYIQGPATEFLTRMEISIREKILSYSQEMNIPAQVTSPDERRWVSQKRSLMSKDEVDYTIIWRNYFMERTLDAKLATLDPNATQDVHVVLGARHVEHFFRTLQRDYPQLTQRYKIETRFDCLTTDLVGAFSF